MRVKLLVGSMDVSTGGPPRVVAGTAIALAGRGHRVDIVSLYKPGTSVFSILEAFPGLDSERIDIRLFEADAPARLGRSRSMRAMLKETIPRCDAVHGHGVWEAMLVDAATVARLAGVPFFVSAHGMLDRWSLGQSALRKKLAMRALGVRSMLRGAQAILYGTEDEMAESGTAIPGARGAVLPNGVDVNALKPEALPPSDAFAAAHPGLCERTPNVLFFSRVHPKKGLDLLIEAFIALADKHPQAGMIVAGIRQDEEYEARLRDRIAGSGIADRIVFVTDLSGPGARMVFRHADIFALPSHQEGFSMAILEAMALEKPLLISDRCHLPYVSGPWRCGAVVSDDLRGVTEGLRTMLSMPSEALREMGRRGRAVVEAEYGWNAVAARLEALYRGDAS